MKSALDIAREALQFYADGKHYKEGRGWDSQPTVEDGEIAREALAALQPVADERDWKEDAGHENGNYQNICAGCGNCFIGHKRRVVCKVCASLPPQAITADIVDEMNAAVMNGELPAQCEEAVDWLERRRVAGHPVPPQKVEPLQQLYDALIAAGHISDREHINHDELLKLVLHKFAECAQAVEPILDHITFDERSAIASTLTDDLYDSKDWRDGGIVERIEWLRGMYEDKKVEIAELFAMLEAAEEDRKLLNSGCIMTYERDDFGMEYMCERRGLDLRAAIRAAMAKEQQS